MSETPNPPQPEPTPMGTPTGMPDPADVEKNKVMAVLAYLGILVLVPILAAKDSPFAKYHANQGLVLLLVEFGLMVVFVVLSIILGVASQFIGPLASMVSCCSCLLWLPMFLGMTAFTIMGIINAVNGQLKPLPVIGKYTILK